MQLSKVIRWWEQRKHRKRKILSWFQPEHVSAELCDLMGEWLVV